MDGDVAGSLVGGMPASRLLLLGVLSIGEGEPRARVGSRAGAKVVDELCQELEFDKIQADASAEFAGGKVFFGGNVQPAADVIGVVESEADFAVVRPG